MERFKLKLHLRCGHVKHEDASILPEGLESALRARTNKNTTCSACSLIINKQFNTIVDRITVVSGPVTNTQLEEANVEGIIRKNIKVSIQVSLLPFHQTIGES